MPLIKNLDNILSIARDNIVQIIGRRISLQNKGKQYKGLCPFHQEKTGSFTVTPEKGIFYCFGCQEGGSAVQFIMKHEGLEFPQAVELIAAELNISIEYETDIANPNEAARTSRAMIYEGLKAAANHYNLQLKETKNAHALEYLTKRGFTPVMIEKYKLGYACGNSVAKCFEEKILVTGGVLGLPKETSKDQSSYDPLHGRVIIPLSDALGRIVGFTGRLIESKPDTVKYINTHETEIFKKGECLYGYTFAREMLRLRKKGVASELYVLEGQLKTIAALENGFPAVAAGGTGFTERQTTMIYNLSPSTVYIALDTDAAGLKAALRLAPSLRQQELNVQVAELIVPEQAELPAGKIDTDDLMAAGIPVKWTHYDLIEWLFNSFCRNRDNITSSDALTISRIILPIIANHPNSIVRETEIKQLSELSGVSESSLFDELEKLPAVELPAVPSEVRDTENRTVSVPKRMTPARYLCALLLQEHIKDHLYADGVVWFKDMINWPELPVKLLEEIHLIIKIKKHSVITGTPVISACEQIAPDKVSIYTYWLSTVNETLTVEKLNQLQNEIININKQGVAA